MGPFSSAHVDLTVHLRQLVGDTLFPSSPKCSSICCRSFEPKQVLLTISPFPAWIAPALWKSMPDLLLLHCVHFISAFQCVAVADSLRFDSSPPHKMDIYCRLQHSVFGGRSIAPMTMYTWFQKVVELLSNSSSCYRVFIWVQWRTIRVGCRERTWTTRLGRRRSTYRKMLVSLDTVHVWIQLQVPFE